MTVCDLAPLWLKGLAHNIDALLVFSKFLITDIDAKYNSKDISEIAGVILI